MIKIEQGHTEDEILKVLADYYSTRPIIPGLPVVSYSDDNPVMDVNMMNNVRKLSKLVFFALQSDRAKERGWHAMLDVTVSGFTALALTSKDDLVSPKLLDMAVQGSC